MRKAYLPNPGRLWELLFPGVRVWLERSDAPGRKFEWTAVAVEGRTGKPVVLHTHRMNDVAARLIDEGRVPGLEGWTIAGREVVAGPAGEGPRCGRTKSRSRFDFLLRKGRAEMLVEVKSCTLFSERVAMFPDAVTARGKRHIEELAALAKGRRESAVLFLVNSPRMESFLPEFHTDLAFAKALCAVRRKIRVIPLSIGWRDDLTLMNEVRLLPVPWKMVEREARDRGSYFVVLRLPRKRVIDVGRLGKIRFEPGYYVYVGSAMKSLSKRVDRHRRLRKKPHWHIDALRAAAEWYAALPILTADDLECDLARAMRNFSVEEIPGFGSSDCNCPSHLFRAGDDPLQSRRFHRLLQHYRMERVVDIS